MTQEVRADSLRQTDNIQEELLENNVDWWTALNMATDREKWRDVVQPHRQLCHRQLSWRWKTEEELHTPKVPYYHALKF